MAIAIGVQRSRGAALAGLFGPKQGRLRQDYPSLAAALADNLPKPLAEEMATALGFPIDAEPVLDTTTSACRFAPDAVVSISPAVMQATVALLKSHGWSSRAWQ